MEKIILIGGGGHCMSCIDVIEQQGTYNILGILDGGKPVGSEILGYPILGSDDEAEKYITHCRNFLITIGQIKSNESRVKRYNQYKSLGANFPVIVSPKAFVSKHSQVEEGTIVMHHALLNSNTKIGKNCIINSKALVEHDAQVGNHCHISTRASLNGEVHIGSNCFIGSGSTINQCVQICDDTIIASGALISRNISEPGTYVDRQRRV